MEQELYETPTKILVDYPFQKSESKTYSGAIITKLRPTTNAIIFSEAITLNGNSISTKGLHVGIENGTAYSIEKSAENINLNTIEYAIQLSPDLIKEFDEARLNNSYPNIIRFLHTACVYLETEDHFINHLEFVTGEILNRPVAVTHNNGIIIGDRLVIDEKLRLIFYDAILIGRKSNQELEVSYEHFITIPKNALCFLTLLGTENF